MLLIVNAIDRDNITEQERVAPSEIGDEYLGLPSEKLDELVAKGTLIEVVCDGDEKEDEPILAEVHEAARDLHDAGAIDALTMRRFDALCLPPVPQYTGADVRRIRKEANVQPGCLCGGSKRRQGDSRRMGARGQGTIRPCA